MFRTTRLFRPRFAVALAAAFLAAAGLGSCSRDSAASAASKRPLVVVITGSEAATSLEFRGAEDLVRAYASPSSGGEIRHLALPDKPQNSQAVASFIADAASDPRAVALVVEPAVRGSAWGLRKAKEAKPSLLCIAADSSEDILDLEASADLVVDLDRLYRAYIVAWEAKKMGASSLVAVYGFAESSSEAVARERAVMASASSDLGLRYAAMVSPKDADAAAFVRASSVSWLGDYGPAAALYCADPALAPTIIAGAVAGGGMVVDAAGSATIASYAAALGVDLSAAEGDAKKERGLVEKAALGLGMKGRLAAWDSAYAEASVAGLGEFALRVAKGAAKKDELKDLRAALDARSKGAAWIADYDVDAGTGVKSANRVLVRQDLYVLGSGYLQSALQPVPAKYPLLKFDASGQ
jgi:hypothetical protein